MSTTSLIGAGGKMGCRITDNLKDSDLRMLYVEVSEAGIDTCDSDSAGGPQEGSRCVRIPHPDASSADWRRSLPMVKSGAMVICLVAAPFAGKLPARGTSRTLSHPCIHPWCGENRSQRISSRRPRKEVRARAGRSDYARGRHYRRMFAPSWVIVSRSSRWQSSSPPSRRRLCDVHDGDRRS
jgi:hypothetical protein